MGFWEDFIIGAYLTLATFFSLAGSFLILATYMYAFMGDWPMAISGAILTLISFYGTGMWWRKAREV